MYQFNHLSRFNMDLTKPDVTSLAYILLPMPSDVKGRCQASTQPTELVKPNWAYFLDVVLYLPRIVRNWKKEQ